jgi:signal transduction histidine kinase
LSAHPQPNGLQLAVEDDGEGISSQALPHIFDRFYREDKSRQQEEDREPGSGLGLAIVKSIVEVHGGAVSAQSEPGSGTTFRIDLPNRMGGSRRPFASEAQA